MVFTRKGIEKISRFVRACLYLVLTCQVQARSSVLGNSAPPQQVFRGTLKELINEDYSISVDIERYQGVLEHELLKADFSVGTGIYVLPSNLDLNIEKTAGYTNKILVSNTDMKFDSNKEINKLYKKLPMTSHEPNRGEDNIPKIDDHAVQHDNSKMLPKKHNDEKLVTTLLIVGAGMIAYYFWQWPKIKWHRYYS